ncbi:MULTISPECIES: PstS family phosphate ABC transporter substrate-binding protein [Vibrio]|jgi:phosphate transport system substrate-binding protein|uniref:PstS family phosphate ABC transporter substrate-binding protein n=1 Tax=Vibrio TaxID=662 RepID=UPI000B8E2AF3|nr:MULTISPECIES: phosphate ABC transporter substrate-binding protein PstS family protein [unclassified Vibrio]NAX43819.1 phosphate ABC transporter substrate-binding protein PstS family protein [Vibrio sp. V25_P4S6T154]OXX48020.1 phosphate ABC transporter substrate-binding protein [Vibrio sp. V17_P4S1T151]OXX58789.1 phosphate ABC transporter substrate-binding protein [Vibrio sp. V15_P4S5T153]OXX63552.1 phosphate ABC transporter substrate-binding protein [Vibrio sp. V20_P4S3T152]
MIHRIFTAFLYFYLLVTTNAVIAQPLVDYSKTNGVAGSLLSVGSDTLAGMTTLWVEEFKTIYPNINAQVQASGSSTAPPALTEGTAQFGPMSRPMRGREIEAFERAHGYKPTALRVAIDAIGIFVHRDNSIKGLNFTQLDSIFSSTLRCGATQPINTWAQLGVDEDWAKRGIQLFGRNSVSGTYGYFKQNALCGGDFKKGVNEQPGSASVVQSVASSINTIGYSGVGYQVSGVKLIPIAKQGDQFIAASYENILSGAYPLSRYLYVYVNKHPNQDLPPMQREFIRFIFSKQGQAIVGKDGYVPVSAEFAQQELAKVGIK